MSEFILRDGSAIAVPEGGITDEIALRVATDGHNGDVHKQSIEGMYFCRRQMGEEPASALAAVLEVRVNAMEAKLKAKEEGSIPSR